MQTFAQRVNARILDITGGLGIWDIVGDWDEAAYSAANDVDGAIVHILDEAGMSDYYDF